MIVKKENKFALLSEMRLRSLISDLSVEGTLAQLVEHRTENPGVPGSIPGGTTTYKKSSAFAGLFLCPSFKVYSALQFSCSFRSGIILSALLLVIS